MAWLIGIDEAGYGPNLGPLVMTSVAWQVPDALAEANLWTALDKGVRRQRDPDQGRVVVDDSKEVYGSTTGLGALEASIVSAIGQSCPFRAGYEPSYRDPACRRRIVRRIPARCSTSSGSGSSSAKTSACTPGRNPVT